MSQELLDSTIKECEKKWFQFKNPEDCTFPDKPKIIRDSVYGTFKIDPSIVFLLDLPCFQRLRRIRQLGFADLIYPGAHHSRFEHSLGTSYLSDLFLRHLKVNNPDLLDEIVSEELILEHKIAALLHDIGHLPFSHVTETVLSVNTAMTEIIQQQGLEDTKVHEMLSNKLIQNEYISKAIERINSECGRGFSPSSIAGIVLGKPPESNENLRFLGQILHGPIDIDRIDYLHRDGYYTGVPFAKVDLGRLVHIINVNEGHQGKIDFVADIKGIQTIEALIVARALMYSSVYYHHTARACSCMVSRTVFSYYQEKEVNSINLLMHDDGSLLNELNIEPEFSSVVNNIKYQKLPKTCISLKPTNIKNYIDFESFQETLDLVKVLEIESSFAPHIIFDIPKYEEYEEIHTYIKDDELVQPVSHCSNIIKGISENKQFLWLGYVFSNFEDKDEIRRMVSEYFAENRVGLSV